MLTWILQYTWFAEGRAIGGGAQLFGLIVEGKDSSRDFGSLGDSALRNNNLSSST